MDQAINWGKIVLAAIGGSLAWVYGAWDPLFAVLLAFVALDYVSGVACGAAEGKLSSAIGFKGLVKKMGIVIIVAVACLLDRIVPAANGALRSATCMFFVANEGISILENWAKIGLPLPDAIRKALLQLKDGGEVENKE
jgi:toxin secretion/phage lysis holin